MLQQRLCDLDVDLAKLISIDQSMQRWDGATVGVSTQLQQCEHGTQVTLAARAECKRHCS